LIDKVEGFQRLKAPAMPLLAAVRTDSARIQVTQAWVISQITNIGR
jgi:hypothetical protein